MASFMIDPSTGRKVLVTRRRSGGGCHGKKNLLWKSHGDGLQTLCCRVCGGEHGERLLCFRCHGFKELERCRSCAAKRQVPIEPQLSRLEDDDVPLACKGTGGLCCRCAGVDAVREEEI